jgi:hypothetical protein
MPPAYTATHSEERTPFHVANSSSSTNSVGTLQRASSFSPAKSKSRGQPQPQPPAQDYNDFDFTDPRPVTSAEFRRRPSVDGAENLNRWSRSTSSSKDRRLSFGGSGTFTFTAPEEKPSPKRLQKGRPSTANSSSRLAETSRPPEPSTNLLPPIIALPALQTSVKSTPSPMTASPSTAGLLSAAVHSAAPDYFSAWDSTTRDVTQRRSPSRSRAANKVLSPSPVSGSPNGQSRLNEGGEGRKSRGHSRNRSQTGKSSTGSSRNSKQPSQKAMLSKALQKANNAVLLDNAQNFQGAMHAYSEACSLLQQVMMRSSGEEDKRKLEAIVSLSRPINVLLLISLRETHTLVE